MSTTLSLKVAMEYSGVKQGKVACVFFCGAVHN
jgi:hypothetical protein